MRRIRTRAKRGRWSAVRLERELRGARCTCPDVWRLVRRELFGFEVPDMRQLTLFP